MLLASVLFPDPVVAVNVMTASPMSLEGTSIATVDLATFEVRATLDLSLSGATTLQGIVFDGKTIFAIDANRTVWSVSVNGDLLTRNGSLTRAIGERQAHDWRQRALRAGV